MIETKLADAEVLMHLYNNAQCPGPTSMAWLAYEWKSMSLDEAEKIVEKNGEYQHYDYVKGRVVKTDITERPLNPRFYDRDNGEGAMAQALGS